MNEWQQKVLAEAQQWQQNGDYSRCPRCGEEMQDGTQQRDMCGSRRADIYVCPVCGAIEAVEDAGIIHKADMANWWIFRRRDDE